MTDKNTDLKTYTLKYPIEHDGDIVKVLTIKNLTVFDIKEIDRVDKEIRKAAVLISQATDISMSVIKKLDGKDFMRLSEIITEIMEPTGSILDTKKGSVLTLENPVKWGEEVITELNFRRLNYETIDKSMSLKGDVKQMISLISTSSSQALTLIGRLSAGDYASASKVIGNFM